MWKILVSTYMSVKVTCEYMSVEGTCEYMSVEGTYPLSSIQLYNQRHGKQPHYYPKRVDPISNFNQKLF